MPVPPQGSPAGRREPLSNLAPVSRGIRARWWGLAIGLGVVVAGLAVWAVLAGPGGHTGAGGQPTRDPCPGPYKAGKARKAGKAPLSVAALRRNDLEVLGRPIRLVPPVDWAQDPYHSKSWRSKLHAMGFLTPLLQRYSQAHDTASLRQARDLMLDWIRANKPDDGGIAWKNKIVGDRAGQLAYVTAASECAGILSSQQRETLRDSATAHGKFLADPANYRHGNHGLFQNQGLLLLTGLLPSLPHAREWNELASQRMIDTLPIDRGEGVDLEHSPGYHFLVLNLLQRVLGLPGQKSPELLALYRRMRAVAGWFVMPDGGITRLGDTAIKSAPPWARAEGASYRGISPTLRSGFAVVRQGGGYLSIADGLHPYGHRQADELTFELFDRGRHIVTDTGRYGASRNNTDPRLQAAYAFTKSSQAHSGLVVDGVSYPVETAKPFGSGFTARGQGSGWYAVEGVNPLVSRQGVRHDRLFLYRPGSALVVIDRVSSARPHAYTRYFQFDPALRVSPRGKTVVGLSAPGFLGSLVDAATGTSERLRVVRGQRQPLLGFTTSATKANKFATFTTRSVAVFSSRAASASYASLIWLGAGRASVGLAGSSPTAVSVRLSTPGRAPVVVTATRRGSRLVVAQGPAGR